MSKIVCIIQTRTGSSRLPGKVLKLLVGQPMLSHLIDRLKAATLLEEIIIATTALDQDLPIVELSRQAGVNYFRGDEDDVLLRYVGAAKEAKADVVVRVTGDCPLIDPVTVDNVVSCFLNHDFDYVGAGVSTGFPRGLDTEVFTWQALLKAHHLGQEKPDREHVTYYIHHHPEHFKLGYYQAPPELRYPGFRLCVDEEDDFRLINEIYQCLYRPGEIIDIKKVIELLKKEPELALMNVHVKQKLI